MTPDAAPAPAAPGRAAPASDASAPRSAARPPAADAARSAVAGTVFLRGAAGRLLPASVPFRYFGAAVAYHALAWIALFAGADDVPRFAAGLGWPLAALHLLTLGVLAMLALGASVQLLPVATRQPVASRRLPALLWWVYTPGVGVLALGMGLALPRLLALGALAVVVALVAFAALLARNLAGARGMPTVVAHGWVGVISLGVALATATALVAAYEGRTLLPWATARGLHVVFAAFGFMGMLALGLSYVVVPMFALGPPPPERKGLASCGLAAVALLLAAIAIALHDGRVPGIAAACAGIVAVALHVHGMRATLRAGLRRTLGRSFTLVRLAWAFLAASVLGGVAVALHPARGGVATMFGLLVVGGWLLTFALGILQRIVPFLASMHAARGRHLPPTPTALTAATPLALHFHAHVVALGLTALAIGFGSPTLVRIAALAGLAGAVAFAAFYAAALVRMARSGDAVARRSA